MHKLLKGQKKFNQNTKNEWKRKKKKTNSKLKRKVIFKFRDKNVKNNINL